MIFDLIIRILSIAIVLYLLANAFLHIEFAVTKNNALNSIEKKEIDHIQHLDTVKAKAKDYLDIIRRVHRNYSNNSTINFWLLMVLITLQIILRSKKEANLTSKNNFR